MIATPFRHKTVGEQNPAYSQQVNGSDAAGRRSRPFLVLIDQNATSLTPAGQTPNGLRGIQL